MRTLTEVVSPTENVSEVTEAATPLRVWLWLLVPSRYWTWYPTAPGTAAQATVVAPVDVLRVAVMPDGAGGLLVIPVTTAHSDSPVAFTARTRTPLAFAGTSACEPVVGLVEGVVHVLPLFVRYWNS